MYSQQELDDAVAAGAINQESANALRAFVAQQRQAPAVDEEHFRLITGFNDIFVALASGILLFAMGWIGQSVGEAMGFYIGASTPEPWDNGPSAVAGILVAVTAWGLASYFTAKRRMALPSILLMFAFVGGVAFASGTLLAQIILSMVGDNPDNEAALVGGIGAVTGLITAAGAWFHWKRFRVPVTVAAGAAAVAGIVVSLVAAAVGDSVTDNDQMETIILSTVLVLGIAIFLYAMRWDMSDTGRVTRRSDVAFWLHLLAAPMIVHPIFTLLGLNDGDATITEGFVVVLLYVALGIAALAIDRRALLVSGLAYVIWALSDLFEQFGAIELNIALTALVIGSALLLLSAFWHQSRAKVIGMLPPGLTARLPHQLPAVKALNPEPTA